MVQLLALVLSLCAAPVWAQEASPGTKPVSIRVNSFLVEEAFTQEEGVVEHISSFRFSPQSRDWEYSFTQEWPLFSARHQLSFTLPLQSAALATSDGVAGFGDVEVSYGYQLMGDDHSPVFLSPRLNLMLPTGDAGQGHGTGAPGVEASLPMSVAASRTLVANWNLGASYTPSARNRWGEAADVVGYEAGTSVIWMAHPLLGLIAGAVWESEQEVDGRNRTSRNNSFFLAPGIRGTVNLTRGLQLVPGVVVPIGVGPSGGERAVHLFLSVEHPFQRR